MSWIFWRRFFGAWLIAFLSLSLTRLVFYTNLQTYFEGNISDLFDAFLFGLRFDAVSIAYLLGPFFIALPFIRKGISEQIAKLYFIGMLAVINLLNCIDAEFFKFTARRSTDDLFEYVFLSEDALNLAPELLTHFWHLLLVWILIIGFCWWLYKKVFTTQRGNTRILISILNLIPTAIFLILGARGGIQPIPLTIIDAGRTENQELNSVVLNTSFTILKTIGKPELAKFEFNETKRFPLDPIIHFTPDSAERKLKNHNVVIIIMESFGSEYIGFLNGLENGYTPFLDSLCGKSLVFTHAFANGMRSIEGIPAVVASIPTLMYEPYSTSRYANNGFSSLANLLGKQGYYSAFMHGGNTNSMNFESFARQAGFEDFIDRNDYPFPDQHYDGTWGIPDHYFLNHCVKRFSGFQQPFVSTIFTLSSHHPYTIPKQYQNTFPKGTLAIHESIGYADEALRQFFEKATQTNWYDSTLFVITSDHTSLSNNPQFRTKLGSLQIPIILFHPNNNSLRGINHRIMQQTDIMPTILDLLGYEKPFFSFGVSVFDDNVPHAAVAFRYDQFQVIKEDIFLCFDGENTTFVHNLTNDSLLQHNLLGQKNATVTNTELYLKKFLNNYSTALIDNRMTYDYWIRKEK